MPQQGVDTKLKATAHLMQDRASGFGHLVKLIDAADASVAEDERTRLKHKLASLRVLRHVPSRGQTQDKC